MLSPQTFENVSPDVFAALCSRIKSGIGVEITGNIGDASHAGFEIAWSYNPQTRQLTVQCLNKPVTVPGFMIQNKIRQLVADGEQGKSE